MKQKKKATNKTRIVVKTTDTINDVMPSGVISLIFRISLLNIIHLLPPVKKVCYKLRTPSYELFVHKLKQTRCSYLVRMVFENVPV